MSNFHHAYNGIPTLRSNESFFRDGEPAPLDHLAPGTYSGTLKLTIETKTPLITAWRDTNGRLVVPSATGNPDGATTARDAMIPATSLKGVLSSAYEAITRSRFRVFGDHTKLPQFRYTPDHKPKRQAAFLRFEEGTTQWSLHIQDYAILPDSIKSGVIFTTNTNEVIGGYTREPVFDNKGKQKYTPKGQPIYKQVERHHESEEISAVNKLLEEVRKNTTHLTKIDSFDAFEQKFWHQDKMVVSKVAEIPICKPKHPESTGPIKQIQRTGWIVRLNIPDREGKLPDDKRLIDTKYNEYIFYAKRGNGGVQIKLNSEEVSRFTDIVLAAARFQHQKEQNNDSRTSGQHSLITRILSQITKRYGKRNLEEHLTQERIYQALIEEATTEPGIPVFTTNHRHKGREIVYSYLGRSISLSSDSPSEIADRTDVRPAHSFEEATAADRLWGFVTQSTSEDSSPALKGRIYLKDAHLCTDSLKGADEGGWIPPILASPKPSTAQPYLRSRSGDGIFELERSKCFTTQHSLIRKTYPTHRFLTSKGASQPSVLNKKNRELTDSEVLIGSYIMPEATLVSVLRFEGLTAQELSTILWLLTPSNLVPELERGPGKKGYFHLGLGKPLGLGTASISAEILSIHDSLSLAEGYKHLDTNLYRSTSRDDSESEDTATQVPESITRALPGTIAKQSSPAVLAFVRSAYGWTKDENQERDPVLYTPYPNSDKKSSIIDYFKEYEQKRIKGEAQRFEFRMLALEEDNDSRTTSPLTTGAPHTAAGQTPTSNAAQNASSPRKSKALAPLPGPGLRRVTRH